MMTLRLGIEYLINLAEVSDRKLTRMYSDPSVAFTRWTTLGYYCYSREGAHEYEDKIKIHLGDRAHSFRFRVRNTIHGHCVQVRLLTDTEKSKRRIRLHKRFERRLSLAMGHKK